MTDKKIRATTRETWTVGRLAQLAGTTIRTLRYYDEIGLLAPSGRSEGGYRLYDADDVVRLGQIQLLRGAGFS
ncbi:MAG: MerR family transcriptional regulator, partial [Capsulimonas sp.]|uniref:MerR family transcriptional regulator n=1 Tax=Capsulimonas sp. TaxID=2494211 RepID=UPI003265ED89